MLNNEDLRRLIWLAIGNFSNKDVKLHIAQGSPTATRRELERYALRAKAAIDAVRVLLNEYEWDVLNPILSGEPTEQLI